MPRATWKGFLKLSLVNIPVQVFSATESSGSISFNQLHAECRTRIQQKRWCPHCNVEVPYSDIVKGYEVSQGEYVVVDQEDFDKVHVESTKVINLETFTDADAIDPIHFDRAYYLAPDGAVARQAFAVVREGMVGKAGIGKVALSGREYLVKVEPKDAGLVMYTLRHTDDVRKISDIPELTDLPAVSPKEVDLAKQVIATFAGDVDWSKFRDEYQRGLQNVIQAKVEGREIVESAAPAPTKVVNLMDALRKSLDAVSSTKKATAKASKQVSADGEKAQKKTRRKSA